MKNPQRIFFEKMPYCYKNGKAEAIEVMMGKRRGKGEKGGRRSK